MQRRRVQNTLKLGTQHIADQVNLMLITAQGVTAGSRRQVRQHLRTVITLRRLRTERRILATQCLQGTQQALPLTLTKSQTVNRRAQLLTLLTHALQVIRCLLTSGNTGRHRNNCLTAKALKEAGMLQLVRGNSLFQGVDALRGADRRLHQLSALKRRLAQQALRLRRRQSMTLTRLPQQQHRTSKTLMRRTVALHRLNTLRKAHRRTSRRQISRGSLTARRSVTVTRLGFHRRALDGA